MFIKNTVQNFNTYFIHVNFKFNHDNPEVVRIFYEKIIRNLIVNSWYYVRIDFSAVRHTQTHARMIN